MGERALGAGLLLLSIALGVGPIVAAFATNNWDLKATVVPSQDQINGIEDKIENIFGGEFSENTFNASTTTINLENREIREEVSLVSPFGVDVKITEISAGVSCEQHGVPLGSVHMEEQEVDVPANGTANFTLIGTLTQDGYNHIMNVHEGNPPDVTLTNVNLELELYGITVRLEKVG